jgi:hypothetical protein
LRPRTARMSSRPMPPPDASTHRPATAAAGMSDRLAVSIVVSNVRFRRVPPPEHCASMRTHVAEWHAAAGPHAPRRRASAAAGTLQSCYRAAAGVFSRADPGAFRRQTNAPSCGAWPGTRFGNVAAGKAADNARLRSGSPPAGRSRTTVAPPGHRGHRTTANATPRREPITVGCINRTAFRPTTLRTELQRMAEAARSRSGHGRQSGRARCCLLRKLVSGGTAAPSGTGRHPHK